MKRERSETGTPAKVASAAARRRTYTSRRAQLAEVRLGATPRPVIRASLEHALLGFISESAGITGYDIARIFQLEASHFWHAHQGQIYPTLDRMERARWIKSRVVVQKGRPNRRVFTIAPAGERVLRAWLGSAHEPPRFKHASLLRTRFLGHMTVDEAIRSLAEERESSRAALAMFREFEASFPDGVQRFTNPHAMCSYFTLRFGIDLMRTSVDWCEWAIGMIERHRDLFPAAGPAPARSITRRARAGK